MLLLPVAGSLGVPVIPEIISDFLIWIGNEGRFVENDLAHFAA
jgi:hypothetical protein